MLQHSCNWKVAKANIAERERERERETERDKAKVLSLSLKQNFYTFLKVKVAFIYWKQI